MLPCPKLRCRMILGPLDYFFQVRDLRARVDKRTLLERTPVDFNELLSLTSDVKGRVYKHGLNTERLHERYVDEGGRIKVGFI